MSRIGKKPVVIPDGVKAELKESVLTVTGPKGTLSLVVHPNVQVAINANEVIVDIAKAEAELDGATPDAVISDILRSAEVPR